MIAVLHENHYLGEAPGNSREARIFIRRNIDKLWESRPLDPDAVLYARRVGTWTICDVCGMFYRDHPMETRDLDYQNLPWLNRMCDGRTLVKL